MANLTPRKKRAALALVEHGAVSRAAESCGVSRQALHRWMLDPEFTAYLHQVSGDAVTAASRRLVSLMDGAIDALMQILDSGSIRERMRAAELIITHALRLRELTDIEERLTLLERSIKDG
jgi:hypothetical protein